MLVSEHATTQPRYLDAWKLRAARVSAGMSQAALADKAGVTRGELSHHEKGDWGCRPALLARYAEACGKEPEDLMRDEATAADPEPGRSPACRYLRTSPSHRLTCESKAGSRAA